MRSPIPREEGEEKFLAGPPSSSRMSGIGERKVISGTLHLLWLFDRAEIGAQGLSLVVQEFCNVDKSDFVK